MKKLFATLAIMGSVAWTSAQSISFDQTTLDYGTIKKGSDGTRYFTVKNSGNKPLIISKVTASCGCTTPEWSSEPVLPGKTAKIKVGYNTNNQGDFRKLIEVYSNDPKNSRAVLYIAGKVEEGVSDPVQESAKARQAQPTNRSTKK